MAWTSDRLSRLDQADDRSAKPPRLVVWVCPLIGYLWWRGRSSIGTFDIDWVGALGLGGQRLYVAPSLNLVVAVTAGLYRASNGGSPAAESLAGDTATNSFVLPAVLGH
jgi:CubicO group peptidase (beta-lactamase class C family)